MLMHRRMRTPKRPHTRTCEVLQHMGMFHTSNTFNTKCLYMLCKLSKLLK